MFLIWSDAPVPVPCSFDVVSPSLILWCFFSSELVCCSIVWLGLMWDGALVSCVCYAPGLGSVAGHDFDFAFPSAVPVLPAMLMVEMSILKVLSPWRLLHMLKFAGFLDADVVQILQVAYIPVSGIGAGNADFFAGSLDSFRPSEAIGVDNSRCSPAFCLLFAGAFWRGLLDALLHSGRV
ncbi:hypothetical protein Nepgr_017449 [Nepenthes gracilis]|uniref:Uncharacterized protein n=1 Tax=Nepenthes gracilis TaxID=150966 RepID=A0AAD3SQE5_NEPGR|nr:hypothetical protein Nepgr_017449 [Nepenthes gracilis]